MDLIADEHRDRIFAEREAELLKLSDPADCRVFRSSIWDETLYKVAFPTSEEVKHWVCAGVVGNSSPSGAQCGTDRGATETIRHDS